MTTRARNSPAAAKIIFLFMPTPGLADGLIASMPGLSPAGAALGSTVDDGADVGEAGGVGDGLGDGAPASGAAGGVAGVGEAVGSGVGGDAGFDGVFGSIKVAPFFWTINIRLSLSYNFPVTKAKSTIGRFQALELVVSLPQDEELFGAGLIPSQRVHGSCRHVRPLMAYHLGLSSVKNSLLHRNH